MTDHDDAPSRRLDGNAAGGPLAELFTVDLTVALATCAGCGRRAPLAEHDLYADAPALVLRCPSCTAVVLRYAASRDGLRLDLTGARLLIVHGEGHQSGQEEDVRELNERAMNEDRIRSHISELVEEEHGLRQNVRQGRLTSAEEQERLRHVEEALDQCWDLLRQRRARRAAGEDPEGAQARPVTEVEGYLQ